MPFGELSCLAGCVSSFEEAVVVEFVLPGANGAPSLLFALVLLLALLFSGVVDEFSDDGPLLL